MATPASGTPVPPPPPIDFRSNPEAVRVVTEAERLSFGHLVNPTFAVETARIDPLPHQRIAVYQHLLPQVRLRFLLADDAGAGKTIMAGLYIREMLARRLVRRVLVVPPAGLVGNWRRELATLFSLPFTIVTGADARAGNPFAGPDGNLVIVSVDTLCGARAFGRLRDPKTEPYDLVIFDEVHKLSADRQPDLSVRKTDRYRLAEALAGLAPDGDEWVLPWACQHLLLLTATPHMGKDFPYYCLWRLLEPEALATVDAFHSFPAAARRRHFLRRTKEEMVRFDGGRLYPTRVTDTLSYELSADEQRLYDRTTDYIHAFYNRARILNRSAARMAMSVFQRRLASSTFALLRSFQRRLARLDALIDDIESGRLTTEELAARQRRLTAEDVLDEKTGDEEVATGGQEENEAAEEVALGGVVATSLAELRAERHQVEALRDLAQEVYDLGEESKFERLRELLQDERYKGEKVLIFTEHRDTLEFLVHRLGGLGYAGQVAQLHGGMGYEERDAQVVFFKKPVADGGARFMVATDAAGEGINLQFCWLMANYDVPWNPARLEQRMGRIHRYGQAHDPVFIANLVAGKTREGRVLKTLLEKLERIRKELGSDKVFDVVGRLFEGVSLREYMEKALTDEGAAETERAIEGTLTKEQVTALSERERRLYGDGGDVKARLGEELNRLELERWRRLLPGYVRRLVATATPLLGLEVFGDLDGKFWLKAARSHALDPLAPVLADYQRQGRDSLSVTKPPHGDTAVFLHPGEPLFDRLCGYVREAFGEDALRGGVFIDPYAPNAYLFHLALVSVVRRADPEVPALSREEVVTYRLVGLRDDGGEIRECPVEQLLLLRGTTGIPLDARPLAASATGSREKAAVHARDHIARGLADRHRAELVSSVADRQQFVARGYEFQDAELATVRARLSEKARTGDSKAQAELGRIKGRQKSLELRKEAALKVIAREPDLIDVGDVSFLAHALVVPSVDLEDRKRHDADVEAIAVRVAWAHEEAGGAKVADVSTPDKAVVAGLVPHPGFDLLSHHPADGKRAIEVKGRAGTGDIELTENEWVQACNHRDRYWLYVVYDCASSNPRLIRVQDPFGKLIVKAKGSVVISQGAVLGAGEPQ